MSDSKGASGPRVVILAAIDRSPHADGVIAAATAFARATPGAEVHLIHVVPATEVEGFPLAEVYATAMAERRAYLESRAGEVSAATRGIVAGHLSEGEAGRAIVQTAASLDADLIIVGTHGRRGVARWVMGSIAEHVVRNAACPVHVVRPKAHNATQVPEIEPPCDECLVLQRESGGARLWCVRHSQRHPHTHLHYKPLEPFGTGSALIHPES
jgi:nucleotide-binding universal stress UspA family protein